MKERILSERAFQRAKEVIPGGVDSPVRALRSVGATPLFAKEAHGPYITDIDGNTYIDFCMSWGVFILGHNDSRVRQALCEAVGRGSSFGVCAEGETVLAEKVREAFPAMERVRFVNSGTEATMSAIRVARGYTRRDTVVKFEGCYHGHADHLLVSAGSGVLTLRKASSAGVPEAFTRYTTVLPYNDTESLRAYFDAEGDRVAALIIEPVACNMGVVTPEGNFLQTAREVTAAHGALLIFDEVITGFRLAYGGAQERYGISADITCVGKIIGGGLPAAAFGGRADIMNMLAPDGPVYQAGTLSGNPLAMAAGIATLDALKEDAFYDRLERRSARFLDKLEDIISGKGITLRRAGSMFTLFFTEGPVRNLSDARLSDKKRFARYFNNMLRRGVYVSPSPFEANFISAAHGEETLDKVLKCVEESV